MLEKGNKKPKDIVEAYMLAIKAKEYNTRKAFEEVAHFCENDVVCSKDNSLKRNTLLLWVYDKLANLYFKSQNYDVAYKWWKKAIEIPGSYKVRLNIGLNMLELASNKIANKEERLSKIIESASILQQIYLFINDKVMTAKMQKIQDDALKLLRKLKSTH